MASEKTVFKKIIDGEIPADFVYQDDRCVAFRDISPKAPTHILVIPRLELKSLDEAEASHAELLGHLLYVTTQVARDEGLENGYRVIINNGVDGGQEVPHLHLHLVGGRRLAGFPG